MTARRNDLEPVASRTTGTLPVWRYVDRGLELVTDLSGARGRREPAGGVGVKRAWRARGLRPLCGVWGGAPRGGG
jgi:hypothetical protein